MRLACLGSLLMLAVAAAPVQAKIYKWVDSEGRIHYGSQPPGQRDAQEFKVRGMAQPSTAPTPTPAAEEQPMSARTANERAVLAENCTIARSNLATLENPAIRSFRESADAEPVVYSQEQRQSKVDEVKKYLAEYCQD